ncbi:MAG: hypothetical protein ACRCRP_01955 [Metamycoplasmataceae bacterium]
MLTDNFDKEYYKVLKRFDEICKINNFWYSLGDITLLSAVTNSLHYKRNKIIDIFITIETLRELEKKYNNNLISPYTESSFFLLTPRFKFDNSDITINLIIITPTSIEKVLKIKKLKYKIKYFYGNYLGNQKENNFQTKFFFLSFKLFPWIKFSPLSYFEIYDDLYEEKHQGFFLINNFLESINLNWIPNINFKRNTVNFLGLELYIFEEANSFLTNKYGKNFNVNPKIINNI